MSTSQVHDVTEARRTLARLVVELGAPSQLAHDIDCASLDSIAAELRPPNHALRLVELDGASLRHLRPPALTVVDGSLAVVRKVGRRSIELETASGVQRALSPSALLADGVSRGIEILPTPNKGRSFFTRVLRMLAEQPRELLKLLLLALGLCLLGLVMPLATQLVVDRALPERSPRLLLVLVLGTLLVALQRAVFALLQQRAARATQGRIEGAVSTYLFDHLLRLPFPVLARESLGSLLETLRSAQLVQAMITESLLVPLLELCLTSLYVLALMQKEPRIASALMLSLLPVLLLALCFALRVSRLERTLVQASASQNEALYETLTGLLTVRTCGASGRAVLRWLERLLDSRCSSAAIDQVTAADRVVLGFAREIIALGTFVWGGYACLQGELSIGAFLAIIMLADRLIGVVTGASALLAPLLSLRAHLPGIDALLAHADTSTRSLRRGPAVSPRDDAVVMDDVWFRYAPDQPWILRGYSLRIASLANVALQGPSGMGKTTILRLIAGLYAPERGSVRVFGQPPASMRRQVGYLPQEAHLFQGSIQQNLALLSDGAPPEVLHAMAARSGLAHFVATLPMGYETVLPPGATTLSGGQRQLIVWTAAMASGRKLLLLDEALSQLDRISRASLLAMAEEQARTTLSVEHERT